MKAVLSDDEIFRQLVSIIADALRVDPKTITIQSNIIKDFNAESIDVLDIRFRIEEIFDFKQDHEAFIEGIGDGVAASEIAEHFTVERIIAYIKKRLAEQV